MTEALCNSELQPKTAALVLESSSYSQIKNALLS